MYAIRSYYVIANIGEQLLISDFYDPVCQFVQKITVMAYKKDSTVKIQQCLFQNFFS